MYSTGPKPLIQAAIRAEQTLEPAIKDVIAAALEAAGAPRKSFGVADPALKDLDTRGPISELLA